MVVPSGPPRAAVALSRRGLSCETILRWAVQCLYEDEAKPIGQLLQWFLLYLVGIKLSHKQLRALIAGTPGLRLEPTSAKKLNFSAVLEEPPPGFRGFLSEYDALASVDEDTWAEASACLERGGWHRAEDAAHKYYVVASWLQDASPRFGEMSFGRVLSLVRCSAIQGKLEPRAFGMLQGKGLPVDVLQGKGLLGHRDGLLVPYAQSEEHERRLNAEMGQPTHVGPNEQYVKSWEELRQGLRSLLRGQREGCLEVARVKPMFRSSLKTELSETVFGHQSLSKLFGDPQLGDEFSLEMMEGNLNRYIIRARRHPDPHRPAAALELASAVGSVSQAAAAARS